jgi:hypothetical protein
MKDFRSAPITDAMKALLTLVEKAVRGANAITPADVQLVRDAGWSDDAIFDAMTACALFQFYNTWIGATGVAALPDYTPSGKRLASEGYVPAERK